MKSRFLVENWKNFINEEQEYTADSEYFDRQYEIGLVPMSAKPFHEGHMSLIRKASDECKNVIVYVSTSDRKRKGEITIFGEDMAYIWENILQKYLPENVECQYGGSPVRNVYAKLEEGMLEENLESHYAIYTGEEDKNRYSSKYYIDMIERVHIRTMSRGEDTMPISGTLMRSYLSNASQDKFLFLDGLPREVSDVDKEEIFNILFRRLN
jgi:cytidyltransferase-like protein